MPKCRNCKAEYTRQQAMQTWCSYECAMAIVEARQLKAWNAETRKRKKALLDKDRSHWIAKAQTAFNAWVRARDAGLPCISCGEVSPPITRGGQWDAGHFKSRGAYPELRFTEDNCHKQCKVCNGGSNTPGTKGRTVASCYEEELVRRIGQDRVDALKGKTVTAKWTIDELKAIHADYTARLRQLRIDRGE